MGIEIHLGHRGFKFPVAMKKPCLITIMYGRGFCECIDLEGTRHTLDPLQLIDHGLFSASWDLLITIFTINMLKDYHLLILQSQITAHNFMAYLRQVTNSVTPHTISVCLSMI